MKIRCHKCGRLVGEILPGSKIRRGTVYVCAECQQPKMTDCEVSEFLKRVMGGG